MFTGGLRARPARVEKLSLPEFQRLHGALTLEQHLPAGRRVQAFQNNSLDEYQLDPPYFVSAPQLAWNALLKHIDRLIPLITDPKMYRMIKPNIRGGICHSSVRYATTNNKLMGAHYDPQLLTSYIMEVNSNNLYGWAMSQEMPDGDF